MTPSLKRIVLAACLAMLTPISAEAATSTQLKAKIKSGIVKQFGVTHTGISVHLTPALQRARPHVRRIGKMVIGLDKVPHAFPSKTLDHFVAIVPAAPERESFSVNGTIVKASGRIGGMTRAAD